MGSPEAQILDLLRDYQTRNRLSDKQLADRLGIHPSSWSVFRRNLRHLPKPTILAGFLKLFPRRTGVLKEYLVGEGMDSEGDE